MSMKLKTLAAALVLSFSCGALAADATMKTDANNVNTACAEEAKTAGCGSDKVGSGLLKCIHDYKKEHHKDFKISEGCHKAMKEMKEDKAAAK